MTPPGNDSSDQTLKQTAAQPPAASEAEQPAHTARAGAVIDLVSERTRRSLRHSYGKSSSPPQPERERRGARASLLAAPPPWADRTLGKRATPTRTFGFKVARAVQLAVIFAGTLYLLRSCGFLSF